MRPYSSLITEHFLHPRNVGELGAGAFAGRAGSMNCGATVRVSLNIDQSQRIVDAKFKAAGCSLLVGAASFLTEELKGEQTGNVALLLRSEMSSIAEALGEIPADNAQCVALISEALLAAITSYSDSARADWEGDEALICTCFCVSERTIDEAIAAGGLQTIAEVTRACNAGAGCRSCYSLIEDMLADHQRSKWSE